MLLNPSFESKQLVVVSPTLLTGEYPSPPCPREGEGESVAPQPLEGSHLNPSTRWPYLPAPPSAPAPGGASTMSGAYSKPMPWAGGGSTKPPMANNYLDRWKDAPPPC